MIRTLSPPGEHIRYFPAAPHMEAGTLHQAVLPAIDLRDLMEQVFLHPPGIPVPLDAGRIVVDGPGFPVQVQTSAVCVHRDRSRERLRLRICIHNGCTPSEWIQRSLRFTY